MKNLTIEYLNYAFLNENIFLKHKKRIQFGFSFYQPLHFLDLLSSVQANALSQSALSAAFRIGLLLTPKLLSKPPIRFG
ncbi:hypothetical protein, partial [Vibrio parahaemolyticus]|uniref:hypothetical protein n=1 Tax=Vibrio parahaemolyticus TaxID=670 RepID=UPI001E5D9EB9